MRNTIVASFAAIFLVTGFVGCKSAPKMPWSKTAAVSNEGAATLAHSAPALPADVVKQVESLAATSPSINLTSPQSPAPGSVAPAPSGQAPLYSQAPAYTPSVASLAATTTPSPTAGSGAKTIPAAYPTTGATPYSVAPAATIAAITPSAPPAYQSTDKSAELGSIAMPYNPNAVPPAKTIATRATPVTPQISADRYGSSSVASTAPASGGGSLPPIAKAVVPKPSSFNRYANIQTASASPAPVTPSMPPAAKNLSSSGTTPRYGTIATTNDRYATSNATSNTGGSHAIDNSITPTMPSMPAVPQQAQVTPTQINAATMIASATSYRPGGTSSYAGLGAGQPTAEIATRPNPAGGGQVPHVTAPNTTPEPSQAPRYR